MVPSNSCGSVHEPRRGAVENALELLNLPPLDLGERALNPPRGVCLLALDPAKEILLAGGHPLCDLMERSAPLCRMHLQLRGGVRSRLCRGATEILTSRARAARSRRPS